MRTYYAVNYRDPGDTAWFWTGCTLDTLAEAKRLVTQLRQRDPSVAYQIEPVS